MADEPDAPDRVGRLRHESGDAAKDRFRAALERKKGHQHPHEAASQRDSKVHDAHSAAGGKRTFGARAADPVARRRRPGTLRPSWPTRTDTGTL